MKQRKTMLLGAAVAAFALLITGCSSSTPDASKTADVGAAEGASLEGTTLTIVNSGGPYLERVLKAWGEPFTTETGAIVRGDQPANLAKIQSMVEAKKVIWDVVDQPPINSLQFCNELFEPLDYSIIDKNLVPEGDATECGISDAGYANTLTYNTAKFGDNPPKDWADFFDTKKFPGKRALWSSPLGVNFEIALLADGVAPEDLYPLDYDRAIAKLDTIRDDLIFWNTSAESQQMMSSNEVDMLMLWTPAAYIPISEGATFAPVWNQHILYFNHLTVVKGSPNVKASMEFINFALQEKQQSALATLHPISPANPDAKPTLDKVGELLYASTPERLASGVRIDYQWVADHADETNERWTAWINQ